MRLKLTSSAQGAGRGVFLCPGLPLGCGPLELFVGDAVNRFVMARAVAREGSGSEPIVKECLT
jgi:hypothetical protein